MVRCVVGKWQVGGKLWVRSYFLRILRVQLEFARVLHGGLLVPVLMYGSETVVWREEERSRIRAVQMDNFRSI